MRFGDKKKSARTTKMIFSSFGSKSKNRVRSSSRFVDESSETERHAPGQRRWNKCLGRAKTEAEESSNSREFHGVGRMDLGCCLLLCVVVVSSSCFGFQKKKDL